MVPIAVETFGAWGPEGAKLISSIGEKIKTLTGEKRSTFFFVPAHLNGCAMWQCRLYSWHYKAWSKTRRDFLFIISIQIIQFI